MGWRMLALYVSCFRRSLTPDRESRAVSPAAASADNPVIMAHCEWPPPKEGSPACARLSAWAVICSWTGEQKTVRRKNNNFVPDAASALLPSPKMSHGLQDGPGSAGPSRQTYESTYHGSGDQINSSGGVQNISKGDDFHMNGATFHQPVYLGECWYPTTTSAIQSRTTHSCV